MPLFLMGFQHAMGRRIESWSGLLCEYHVWVNATQEALKGMQLASDALYCGMYTGMR